MKRFSGIFLVLLVLGFAFAGIAAIVPLLICPTCSGFSAEEPYSSGPGMYYPRMPGWDCFTCRDRGKVSVVAGTFGSESRTGVDDYVWGKRSVSPPGRWSDHLNPLFLKNGVDRESWYSWRPGWEGFPIVFHGYVPIGDEVYFALAQCSHPGRYCIRHPAPYGVRVFLFDLDGRLLDRMDLYDARREQMESYCLYAEGVDSGMDSRRPFLRVTAHAKLEFPSRVARAIYVRGGEGSFLLSAERISRSGLWKSRGVARIGIRSGRLVILQPSPE